MGPSTPPGTTPEGPWPVEPTPAEPTPAEPTAATSAPSAPMQSEPVRSEPPRRPPPPAPPLSRASSPGARRVVVLAVLALLSVYTVRLPRQFAVSQSAEAKRLSLAARVAALETETAAIQTETAFAGSDAYVERWAREDQHMVRPGDQPVQVALATPSTPAAGTPEEPGLFERLWGWLRR